MKPQGQPALRPGLTKRQTEVLERLEHGVAVRKIAKDIGITRAAVYQTIDRLRRAGAVPETYRPSGQASAGRGGVPAGTGVSLGGALPPRESRLAELRGLGPSEREGPAYAELVEAAIARDDVPALAYELGRSDATGEAGLARELVEAGLRRLGALGDPGEARS